MAAPLGGKSLATHDVAKDEFVSVRKRDLEKLTTEVMQLRDFLPRVLNGDLLERLRRARAAQTVTERHVEEGEKLRRECRHLRSRLEAAQTESQKEREEKLLLRERLWQAGAELRRQADFCAGLGSAACGLLWSCAAGEDVVARWLTDGKLLSFLAIAAQTLESFVASLDEEDPKTQTEDHNSHEHQFVLALAGTITNIAAVSHGRDFLSASAHGLLETLVNLLGSMKPAAFPKLKVLLLMALYNISISVEGLKLITASPGLASLIRILLGDRDWEVCVHTLRLLQSVFLLEEEEEEEAPAVARLLGTTLLDPDLLAHIGRLASSAQPGLRQAAEQTLEDLKNLQQGRGGKRSGP